MRQKIILTILISTLCLFILTPLGIYAQEKPYDILLSDMTYNYVKTEERGANIVEFFNINITLRNLGVNESDEITLELIDQDNMSVKRKHTFGPLEKKSFLFSDYPILGTGDHEITIKFYPTNETKKTNYNLDSEILVINKNNSKGGSTSGFEITLITIAIALFIFLKKKAIL